MDKATREKIARNAGAVYRPQSIFEQLQPAYPRNASRIKIDAVRARKNGRAILEQMEKLMVVEPFARDGDAALAHNGRDRKRVTVLDRGSANNSNGLECHSVNVDVTP